MTGGISFDGGGGAVCKIGIKGSDYIVGCFAKNSIHDYSEEDNISRIAAAGRLERPGEPSDQPPMNSELMKTAGTDVLS